MKLSKPIFILLILCFLIISNTELSSSTITSKRNGNWDNSSTWVGGVIPGAGDVVEISSGNIVSTNGNRTCAGINIAGTLSMNYGNIINVYGNVSGSGIWSTGIQSKVINLTGDWDFKGKSYGNESNIIFIGSKEQILSGDLLSGNCNLEVNKSSGSVTLKGSKTVNGTVTLKSGNISTTNTDLLIIGSSASIKGGNISSYIDGPLSRIIAAAGMQNLTFPVGIAGYYKPLDLYFYEKSSISTTYTVELVHSAPPSLLLPASLKGISTIGYYTISKSGGSAFTNGIISIKNSGEYGNLDNENLRIAKSEGKVWKDLGFSMGNTNDQIISNATFSSLTDNIFILAKGIKTISKEQTKLSSLIEEEIDVQTSSKLENFKIGNYPNPFNPTTVIKFEIPEATHVTLTIYNITGERVATLVDEEMNAGVYQRAFSSNSICGQLSSGIYLYRLATDNGIDISKKMVLTK